jgi:hypothetical protein
MLSWLWVRLRVPLLPARSFNFVIKNALAGDAKNAVERAVPITA